MYKSLIIMAWISWTAVYKDVLMKSWIAWDDSETAYIAMRWMYNPTIVAEYMGVRLCIVGL